jgi:hypothetical protein
MPAFYPRRDPVDGNTFCADSGRVTRWRLFSDRTSLRAAAATIFALTAILPLSTLVMVLWRSGLLDEPPTQVNVLLALVIALLGFVLFQHLVRRIASVAEAMHGGEAPADAVVPAVGRVSEISAITDAFSGCWWSCARPRTASAIRCSSSAR